MFLKQSQILLGLGVLVACVTYAQPSPAANNTGEKIFTTHCTVCHSQSMAPLMKAPIAQDSKSWDSFVTDAIKEASANKVTDCAALTKTSSDTSKMSVSDSDVSKLTTTEKACYLLPIAIKGKTSNGAMMPPKGACVNCKDSDLQSAIEFMLTDK